MAKADEWEMSDYPEGTCTSFEDGTRFCYGFEEDGDAKGMYWCYRNAGDEHCEFEQYTFPDEGEEPKKMKNLTNLASKL